MSLKLYLLALTFYFIAVCYAYDYSEPFDCPKSFGECNKCVKSEGKIWALSRKVCGEYNQGKCQKMFKGKVGLCDDGCNTCVCGAKGIASTRMGCPRYKEGDCLDHHPEGDWECNNTTCQCTPFGVGYLI